MLPYQLWYEIFFTVSINFPEFSLWLRFNCLVITFWWHTSKTETGSTEPLQRECEFSFFSSHSPFKEFTFSSCARRDDNSRKKRRSWGGRQRRTGWRQPRKRWFKLRCFSFFSVPLREILKTVFKKGSSLGNFFSTKRGLRKWIPFSFLYY